MTANARNQATVIDHEIVEQDCCVYCGCRSISPRFYRNGSTRHLDHFIPIEIVMRARSYYPRMRIHNFLLPCCLPCNLFLGQLFFARFQDKFEYLQDLLRSRRNLVWNVTDNPQCARLRSVRASTALLAIVRPIGDCAVAGYTILCPQKLNDVWIVGQECERVLCL
jgi:hypothetical protein